MITKRIGFVLFAAIATFSVAAHAAPVGPSTPVLDPKVNPNPNPALLKLVSFDVLPTASKCGANPSIQVKVTNKSAKPWQGMAFFVVDSQDNASTETVEAGATKVITAVNHNTNLNCGKALGAPKVLVIERSPGSGKVFEKALKPTQIKMATALPQAPNPTTVWLRRAEVSGSCGSVPQVAGTLMLQGGAAQQASVKLSFGSVASVVTVQVPPNQPTVAKLPVTTPLDCQAATGIPPLQYTFGGAFPASGSVSLQEVTFED